MDIGIRVTLLYGSRVRRATGHFIRRERFSIDKLKTQ